MVPKLRVAPRLHRARPVASPPRRRTPPPPALTRPVLAELPWERAAADDARYAAWAAWAPEEPHAQGAPPAGVWRKLPAGALALLRRALHPDAARRASLDELRADRWLAEDERGERRGEYGGQARPVPAHRPPAAAARVVSGTR